MNQEQRVRRVCSGWHKFRKSFSRQKTEDIDIVLSLDCARIGGRQMNIAKLTEMGIASKNTILRRLASLMERKIISADPAKNDRRVHELLLTSKGRLFLRRIVDKLSRLGRTSA